MDDLRTVRVGDAKGAGETGGKHSPRELGCSQDVARMEPGWSQDGYAEKRLARRTMSIW